MKLEISIVLLLCVWATLAQDLLTPTLDLFRELKKINIMGERLNALNDEVRELRSMILNEARAKVAFSATLSSSLGSRYFGPHAEATTLAYENAFTNIGNAYDTNTGIIPLHKVV